MRISMSAMYFTVDVLCVSSATYESTSGLQLLLFVLAPPTAAKREGMWGHPTPRQRALHSALPYVHAQGLRAGSPRPCALCTSLRPRPRASCRISQTLCPLHSPTSTPKGFVPGLPDLVPSALPTHRDLMKVQAIWPGAIRLTYLVQVCANSPCLPFAWH